MKSQKHRAKSAKKNRREGVIPLTPKSNNQTQRERERLTLLTLKEFKQKPKSSSSSSSSNKKKLNKIHHQRRQHSLPYLSSAEHSSDNETINDSSAIHKLILNAKSILGTQSSLLAKCTEMTKLISNTDIELDSIYNQTLINNEQFVHTLNQFRNKIEAEANESNDKLKEDYERFKSLVLIEMNSLNELIGNMGYNYVFHKFKSHNFNETNISEYFSNTKALISALNKKEKEANEKIQQQQNEISAQKEMIASYQQDLMQITARTNTTVRTNGTNGNMIVSSSNLFDSNSFFEGYKRNKELRNDDLGLEHSYTDMNISQSQSTFKGNDRGQSMMNEFEFKK